MTRSIQLAQGRFVKERYHLFSRTTIAPILNTKMEFPALVWLNGLVLGKKEDWSIRQTHWSSHSCSQSHHFRHSLIFSVFDFNLFSQYHMKWTFILFMFLFVAYEQCSKSKCNTTEAIQLLSSAKLMLKSIISKTKVGYSHLNSNCKLMLFTFSVNFIPFFGFYLLGSNSHHKWTS